MPQPDRLAKALVALLVVAGCGGGTNDQLAQPTATPAATPTPVGTATPVVTAQATAASPRPLRSPSPSAAPATLRPTAATTLLRDDDAGSTIRVHVGQRIRVQLQHDTWDPPTSSAAGVVVRRSSSGGYPTDQPVNALFEALRAGTADLSASTDAACFHTEPRCLMPTRLWQVHVLVS